MGQPGMGHGAPRPGPPSQALLHLRNEITQMLYQFPESDMASLSCGVVIEAAQAQIEQFVPQFVQSTFPHITTHIGIPEYQLQDVFKRRIVDRLREHVNTFMAETYQTEATQLLEAVTVNQATPQKVLLRGRIDKMLAEGDERTLQFLKSQIIKHQQKIAEKTAEAVRKQQQQQQQAQGQGQAKAQPANPELSKALTAAALGGDLQRLQTIISQGADINAAPEKGWTSLMNASLNGHNHIVKYLVSVRANLDIKDDTGFTALMYAASYKKADIVETLVAAGSNLAVQDTVGRTIFQYAQEAGPEISAAIQRGQAALQASGKATAAQSFPPQAQQAQQVPMQQHMLQQQMQQQQMQQQQMQQMQQRRMQQQGYPQQQQRFY